MENIVIPGWKHALDALLTARLLEDETLLLPVAGKRTDGKSDYSRLFPRDCFTSAFLLKDNEILKAILKYFAAHQGRKPDSFTAEEPGKIAHELPGVSLRGYNTLFAACDTTAIFLISCGLYAKSSQFEESVWKYLIPKMFMALGYIRAHLENGIFIEDPKYSGAKNFALKATYLRDGGIFGRRGKRLNYPVAFLLVQAQVLNAMQEMLKLSRAKMFPGNIKQFEKEIGEIRKALNEHFLAAKTYPVAIDASGPISFICTDPLQALYYFSQNDVNAAYLKYCAELSNELLTFWGWKSWSLHPKAPGMAREHESVWPADQAFIAEGLSRHFNRDFANEAKLLAKFLSQSETPFTEYVSLKKDGPVPGGCQIQLWTVAYWSWLERTFTLR